LKANMGSVEFFYKRFYYNKHTLTPRLETESLVRLALDAIKKEDIDVVIDVWTGSAIIWISIENNSEIKEIYWLEKSKNAAKVAHANISLHKSNMILIKSDLLGYFFKNDKEFDFKDKNILIVANLPYIKNEDWVNMSEDTLWEPKMALFWWARTGFELYEKFYRQLLKFKKSFWTGKIVSISEIWFDQREVAGKYLLKHWFQAKFSPDLRWIERFITIEI